MQANAFAKGLIEDTANNTVFWSCVGEFGGYIHSIDFRADNKILKTLTDKNPFLYHNWQDVLKELFSTVTSHLQISYNKISDFLEIYFAHKSKDSSNDD